MNFLFFTLSAGEGHNQVAKTIAEELLKTDKSINVKIIDTFSFIDPRANKIVIEGYIKSIKYFPKLYDFFYKKTENSERFFMELGELLSKSFIIKKIENLISSFKPDAIVCTHPIPCEFLCAVLRKKNINIPIINTITDYTLHSSWFNKDVKCFILPADSFKHEIKFWKIPEEKCKFYGIPLRNAFYQELDKERIYRELGLKEKYTLLLMGGGLGLGNIKDCLDHIIKFDIDAQILVVTGKNLRLYEELIKKYAGHEDIKIYGYFPEIHKLMTVANILITKPGGLTIAEAISKELPLILTSTLPGQEERNAEFVLNNGIGLIATCPNKLLSCINTLKNDIDKYNMIKGNMRSLQKPNALRDIVKLLLEEI